MIFACANTIDRDNDNDPVILLRLLNMMIKSNV